MYYKTHARLVEDYQPARLQELMAALEAKNCTVMLNSTQERLELGIPDEQLWWVLSGFITVFFQPFADVAIWSFSFEVSTPPFALQV
ncbi:MAG: hypothetical protein GFH24_608434n33 [Chloroflexi bacterium AL-N5]|nr:hypothetical protein [Chloroflexi bacterium AL-N5]